MKRLLDVAVVLTALCALVVTGLVIRREFFSPAHPADDRQPRVVENWREYARAGSRIGPRDAPVVIVEFSDFQCPYCKGLAASLRAVRARHERDLAIVYRHYPLDDIHPHARTAALASECAGAQQRFEPYHDLLYARQDSIGVLPWEKLAGDAGVPDLAAFRSCLEAKDFAARVEADARAGTELGVEATPSFLLDGKLYRGAVPETELERLVTAALRNR